MGTGNGQRNGMLAHLIIREQILVICLREALEFICRRRLTAARRKRLMERLEPLATGLDNWTLGHWDTGRSVVHKCLLRMQNALRLRWDLSTYIPVEREATQ